MMRVGGRVTTVDGGKGVKSDEGGMVCGWGKGISPVCEAILHNKHSCSLQFVMHIGNIRFLQQAAVADLGFPRWGC